MIRGTGDVEGGGHCAAGGWRGDKRQPLVSKAQDEAVGSCLCNNCSGVASEKVTEPIFLEQPAWPVLITSSPQ